MQDDVPSHAPKRWAIYRTETDPERERAVEEILKRLNHRELKENELENHD
jgi:hypothetical protein